jgi:hypothetical protein
VAAVLGLTVVALVAGCAGSNLIEPDDTTFARAQGRLATLESRPELAAAVPDERRLFLQAEALYQYRYAFRERSFAGHLAQAAAIVTEVPALQAVAGNLDLNGLRLHAVEGAVQLWETLLLRRPATSLRALTLYRLGWAYRNVGAEGFPREDGDEAFTQLRRELPQSELAPLAASAMQTPWRSKGTATALSALPGLGQVYVGEHASGIVRIGVALASVAAIVVPGVLAWQRHDDLTWRRDWPLLLSAGSGFAVLMLDYTLAYQDAQRGSPVDQLGGGLAPSSGSQRPSPWASVSASWHFLQYWCHGS